jgi:hypothetical protein
MPIAPRNVGMGFLAGAIAVLTAHQLIVYVLTATGLIAGRAWSLHPVGPFQVPALLNSAFWGGVWGAIFAVIAGWLPGTRPWSKGLVFGLVFPLLVGAWILVPLIKGQPFLAGLSPPRLLAGVLIHAAYGVALAALYSRLAR